MIQIMNGPERSISRGSFFEWTQAGREYVIRRFRDLYENGSDVPFISYDPVHHVFTIKSDDDMVASFFTQIVDSAIKLHQSAKLGDNFEPLMIPLSYTRSLSRFEANSQHEAENSHQDIEEPLISFEDADSDDSTEGTSSGEAPSVFWTPRCGDISILSYEDAQAIATMTDCILGNEPENKRVRIFGSDIQTALDKLQRMEPLLMKLAQHRAGAGSSVNHHLLSLSSQLPGTGVRYVPVLQRPYSMRIIIPPEIVDQIHTMSQGEERVWDEHKRVYQIPDNMNNLTEPQVPSTGSSNVWSKYLFPSLGNPDGAIPQASSRANSTSSAEQRKIVPPADKMQPSHFLPVQDQARLAQWSRNVDPRADPELAAEQPLEPEPIDTETTTRHRRVEDSDSDVEMQAKEEPPPATNRLLAVDSEDDDDLSNVDNKSPQARPALAPVVPVQIAEQPSPTRLQRANRAERRLMSDVVPNQPGITGLALISSDAFFAGIPRDGDTNVADAAEREPRKPVTNNLNEERQVQPPNRPRRARRGFGFDGAADDSDDGDTQPYRQVVAGQLLSNVQLQSGFEDHIGDGDHVEFPYRPSAAFDPSDYGATRQRNSQRREQQAHPSSQSSPIGFAEPGQVYPSPRGYPNQQVPLSNTKSGYAKPVQSMPGPGNNFSAGSRARDRDAREEEHKRQRNQLIDVDTRASAQPPTDVRPPPGFNFRPLKTFDPKDDHILDSPLEEIQRPSIRPTYEGPTYTSEDTSHSASKSSMGTRSHGLIYTPQTSIAKPDVTSLGNNMVSQLKAVQHWEKKRNEKSKAAMPGSPEKIEEEDEASALTFHSTMNLKAPNPGKKKNKGAPSNTNKSTETPTQKRERIAKALADAHGSPAATKPPVKSGKEDGKPSKSSSAEVPLSEHAMKAAKTSAVMAETHSDRLSNEARQNLSCKLASQMHDSFDTARSFSGHLDFEIQIGQLLVMPSSQIKENKVYEKDKWAKIFSGRSAPPDIKFSNIVTSNGYDISHLLSRKAGGRERDFMWNQNESIPLDVSFELHCLDNTGFGFMLLFNVDGSHSLHRGSAVVSKIGIQCPGQVWDACAVLAGIPKWHQVPDVVEAAVNELVKTIYLEPGSTAKLHFRLPSTNVLTVHNVIMQRVCLRDTNQQQYKNIQLKITETKILYTTSHKVDKHLHKSTERPHEIMAQDDRLHYTLSIVHTEISQALKANADLDLGELTSANITGNSLLANEYAVVMLTSAFQLVDKMDNVGRQNYGTILRLNDAQKAEREQRAMTLPPLGVDPNFIRPVNIPSGHSITGPRTLGPSRTVLGSGSRSMQPGQQPVHGIRAGTQAQVYQDRDGNFVLLGQGGARIPYTVEEESLGGGQELQPDDSASRIGDQPRYVPSRGGHYDKPAGFW